MKRETITAWITRYALTEGIKVAEAEVCSDKMITYGGTGCSRKSIYGNDWHRTYEAALARAEEMRVAKIASLRKSIARIERMTFAA